MNRITSPNADDSLIEQEIQAKGLTAPRVTPEDLEASIAAEHYFTAADGVLGATIQRPKAVDRFLTWPVPAEVYPDGTPGAPGRTGTNLLTAPQARAMLDHVMAATEVAPPLSLLTFCVLVLKNGFTVIGESAVASPKNFDAELGRKIARESAKQKLWPLLGYALKDRLAGG